MQNYNVQNYDFVFGRYQCNEKKDICRTDKVETGGFRADSLIKSKISSRHNISPIEVKSSKNYTLTSLRKFKNKYGEQLHIPYVLHTGDFKEDDGITFLPLHMTSLYNIKTEALRQLCLLQGFIFHKFNSDTVFYF